MSGSSSSPNQLSNEALLAAITQGFSEVKLAIADLAASKKSNSGKGKGAAPPAVNGGVSPLQASGVVSADGAVKNITNRELETKKPSFPNINIYFKTSPFSNDVPECVKALARETASLKAGWAKADAPTQAKKVCNEYWGALTAIKDNEANPDRAVAVAFHGLVSAAHKRDKEAHAATLVAASTAAASTTPASQALSTDVSDDNE